MWDTSEQRKGTYWTQRVSARDCSRVSYLTSGLIITMPQTRWLLFLSGLVACIFALSIIPVVDADCPMPMNPAMRGMNIGGWLVLESWITPTIFEQHGVPGGSGEWEFCQHLGSGDACAEALSDHWARLCGLPFYLTIAIKPCSLIISFHFATCFSCTHSIAVGSPKRMQRPLLRPALLIFAYQLVRCILKRHGSFPPPPWGCSLQEQQQS